MLAFAVEKIVGRVDGYSDKDNIQWEPRECVVIASGAWGFRECEFLPSETVAMAYIGLHWISSCNFTVSHVEHFRKWQPIGCRDLLTLNYFKRKKIAARLNRCPTLGLERWVASDPGGPVVAVDVPKEFRLPPDTIKLTQRVSPNTHPQYVRNRTVEVLEIYQRASLVITTQPLTVLPCIAFGTPVVFVGSGRNPILGVAAKYLDLHDSFYEGELHGNVVAEKRRKELAAQSRSDLFEAIENARKNF